MVGNDAHAGPDGAFRLGGWRVWPREGQIRGSGGRSVHLEPKVMDLLVCLARRPGGVVSHAEIRAEVWPGEHVGDEALRRCVYQLRKALGDDAANPRYVDTVPRRGYRLTVDVEPRSAAPLQTARVATLPGGPGGRPRLPAKLLRIGKWVAIGLLLVVLLLSLRNVSLYELIDVLAELAGASKAGSGGR